MILTAIRIAALGGFLYAAWSDYKHQKVTWRLWPILIAIGATLLGSEAIQGQTHHIFIAILSVTFFAALSYILRTLGTFGGADMWALISVSVLYPVPLFAVPALVVHPISVFINAVILLAGYKLLRLLRGNATPIPFIVPLVSGLLLTIFVGDIVLLLF